MNNNISIKSVLTQIKNTFDENGKQKEFSIKARYTGGPKIGQVYFAPKVSRHLSAKYRETRAEIKRTGIFEENKESGKVLLYNKIKNRPFTIPFWSIMAFNGKKVIHE